MLANLNWHITTVDLQNVRGYVSVQTGDENVERWKLMLLRDLTTPTPDVAKLALIAVNAMFQPEIVWRHRYAVPALWNSSQPPSNTPVVLGVR